MTERKPSSPSAPKTTSAPVPPQDLDAEESVLGAMMLSPTAIDQVVEEMTSTDFYRQSHGLIFSAIIELHTEGEPADAITVSAQLDRQGDLEKIGGRQRVHDLTALAIAWSNARHYARRVHEMALRRSLIATGGQVQGLGFNGTGPVHELVDQAEQAIFDMAQKKKRSEFVYVGETLSEAFKRLDELSDHEGIVGLPTGFAVIDDMTTGLQPGNLVVVAGRPSMGKSAFGLAVAFNNAIMRTPVALFTLEMSRQEITHRLLSAKAMVELQHLRVPSKLDRESWSRLFNVHKQLADLPLLVEDSNLLTATEIRSKARRMKTKHPDLGLVVVDYIQLLSSGRKSENRVQEVSEATRALKVLAGDLEVPVLAMSQLSRETEKRHDQRPKLSDMRESGSIEQDADIVLLLYRDEYYNPEDAIEDGTEGVCEVNIAKHRNGPTGTQKVAFVKKFAMFSDLYSEGGHT